MRRGKTTAALISVDGEGIEAIIKAVLYSLFNHLSYQLYEDYQLSYAT